MYLHNENERHSLHSFTDNCSIIEAIYHQKYLFKSSCRYKFIVERVKYIRYDSNFCHVVSGHIDVHSSIKMFDSIYYLKTPFFDKTVNYSLGVFSKNWRFGIENENNPKFARMYIYMSCTYTTKTSVIACIVLLKIVYVCMYVCMY